MKKKVMGHEREKDPLTARWKEVKGKDEREWGQEEERWRRVTCWKGEEYKDEKSERMQREM